MATKTSKTRLPMDTSGSTSGQDCAPVHPTAKMKKPSMPKKSKG